QGHREDRRDQAGNDVVGGDALRVVAALNDHFEWLGAGRRGGGGQGPLEVVHQRILRKRRERGDGATGGGGIGRVGLDQDLRLVLADDAAGEVAGDGDGELDRASLDQFVHLGRRASGVADVEIVAALEGAEDRAG